MRKLIIYLLMKVDWYDKTLEELNVVKPGYLFTIFLICIMPVMMTVMMIGIF